MNVKAETSVGFGTEGMGKVFFSEELSEYNVHTVQVKRNLAISARVCTGIRKFSAYCCTAICGLPYQHLRVSSAMFVNKRTIRMYVGCR